MISSYGSARRGIVKRIVPIVLLVVTISAGFCNITANEPSVKVMYAAPVAGMDPGNKGYKELLTVQVGQFRGTGQTPSYFMAAFAVDQFGSQLQMTNTLDGFRGATLRIMSDPIFSPGASTMNDDYGIALLTVKYDPSRVSRSDAENDSIRIADFYAHVFNVTFQTNSSGYALSSPPPTLLFYYNPIPNPQNNTYYLSWAKTTINKTLEGLPAEGLAGTFDYQYLMNLGSNNESLWTYFEYTLDSAGYLSSDYHFGRILNEYADGKHGLDLLDALNVQSLTSKYGPVNITCNPVRPYYAIFGVGVRTSYYFGAIYSNINGNLSLTSFSDPNMGDGFDLLLDTDAPITNLTIVFNTVTSPTLLQTINDSLPLLYLAIFLPVVSVIVIKAALRKRSRGKVTSPVS